jgi:hypothetical protein
MSQGLANYAASDHGHSSRTGNSCRMFPPVTGTNACPEFKEKVVLTRKKSQKMVISCENGTLKMNVHQIP